MNYVPYFRKDDALTCNLQYLTFLTLLLGCVMDGETFKHACKRYSMVAMTTRSTKNPHLKGELIVCILKRDTVLFL